MLGSTSVPLLLIRLHNTKGTRLFLAPLTTEGSQRPGESKNKREREINVTFISEDTGATKVRKINFRCVVCYLWSENVDLTLKLPPKITVNSS